MPQVTDAIIELTITVYDADRLDDLPEVEARRTANEFIEKRREEMGGGWVLTDATRTHYNRIKVRYVR